MARVEDVDPEDGADDDAALRWAGDEARGQAGPTLATAASGTDADGSAAASETDAAPSSPVRLVGTGVFAGVFLAYTVGWILSVQAIASPATDLFSEVMWQFGEFLAIVAGALWFASTTYLTRECRTVERFGWLGLGVLLLFPWPIVWGFL